MSEAATQESVQSDSIKKELHALKQAHDEYATTVHMLKTRTKFFYEEFQAVINQVGFYTALRDQCLAKIHEIEPPVKEEPKAPLVIEAAQPEASH